MGVLILKLQAANSTDMSQMPSDPLHAIVILLHSHQALTKYKFLLPSLQLRGGSWRVLSLILCQGSWISMP